MPFVAERIDVAIPGEGQVADTGIVRLLRGDEMAPATRRMGGLVRGPQKAATSS